MSFTLPAPAKLNLFLHVTGRRADGYHTLETVFQFLAYGDSLTFTPRRTPGIQVTPPLPGVALHDNLIHRAAQLLCQETQYQGPGVDIHLVKRLPMGGGVGGGSSDAATTLIALNHLWQLRLTLPQLMRLGVRLGADVPVFIQGVAAFATGIGEVLQPIEIPEPWYLVLIPGCGVKTAEIFADPQLTRDTPSLKIGDFHGEQGHNDCEPVTRRLYPAVAAAQDWLAQYSRARMTGSGACVFATFDSEAEALALLAKKPSQFDGFVSKGCNRSPLHHVAVQLQWL